MTDEERFSAIAKLVKNRVEEAFEEAFAIHLFETPTASKPLPSGICQNCHQPIAENEVYHAGHDWGNNRTIPPTIGRGPYCDHIKRPEGQGPEMTQEQISAFKATWQPLMDVLKGNAP